MFKSLNVQAAALAVLATATTVGSMELLAADYRETTRQEIAQSQLQPAWPSTHQVVVVGTNRVHQVVVTGKRAA